MNNTNISKIAMKIIVGVSDYKHLLERALDKLKSVIDQVYPNGKFTLTLEPDDPKSKKINITFTENTDIGSYVKQLQNSFKVVIDTGSNSKAETFRSLAHEITHISQKMNGFSDYEFEIDYKKVKEMRERKVNQNQIREVMHDQKMTEYEAKLVGVLILLKNGNIKEAIDEVKNEPEYYQFDYRKFINKAISIGVDVKNIFALKTELKNG